MDWKLQIQQLTHRLVRWITNADPENHIRKIRSAEDTKGDTSTPTSANTNTPNDTTPNASTPNTNTPNGHTPNDTEIPEEESQSRPSSWGSVSTQDSYPVIPLVRHSTVREHVVSRVVLVGAEELFDEGVETII